MTPAEEKEVHAMLARQIEGLGTRVDTGFAEMRAALTNQCEGIREELMVVRTEFSDRITTHKTMFQTDIRNVHKRVDDHLDDHMAMSKTKSNGRLPSPVTPPTDITLGSVAKTCGRLAAIGVVISGSLWVLKMVHDAWEAGVFK